jgi:hypothetical protein
MTYVFVPPNMDPDISPDNGIGGILDDQDDHLDTGFPMDSDDRIDDIDSMADGDRE